MKNKKLKLEVNRLRKEMGNMILSQDMLDRLSKKQLEEEIFMLKLSPDVNKLLAETEALLKSMEEKAKQKT